VISLPRLTKKEHLGTWLERCYIVPMQLTYNGSIPLVRFPVVKLQAHFHVKNTQPPHHSHLGLEFTKCTPNHLLCPTDTNLHRFENANCFLQFWSPIHIKQFYHHQKWKFLCTKNHQEVCVVSMVKTEPCACETAGITKAYSACNYIHGLLFIYTIWGPLSDSGRQNQREKIMTSDLCRLV